MRRTYIKIALAVLLTCFLPLAMLVGCASGSGSDTSDSITLENGSAVVSSVEYSPVLEETASMRVVYVTLDVSLAEGTVDSVESELMEAATLQGADGEQYSVVGFNFDLPDPQLAVGFYVPGDVDASTLTFNVGNYSVNLADYS